MEQLVILMAFSFGLPFFMLMKVLTPAFFSRKDTTTPMRVALISLFLNAALNYYLAFVLDLGHVGIAIGSSLAALVSVCILELILYRSGFIKSYSFVSRFSLMILLASCSLALFLHFYTQKIDFIELNKVKKNAQQNDAKTIVFFTEPHASEYFAKVREQNIIMREDSRNTSQKFFKIKKRYMLTLYTYHRL